MRKKAEGRVVFNIEEWDERKSEINELMKSGASLAFLGKKYGVSRQRMSQVLKEIKVQVISSRYMKVGKK